MFDDPVFVVRLMIVGAVFGLVLSVWMMGVLIWFAKRTGKRETLERRLGGVQPAARIEGRRVLRLWHDGKEATTIVTSILRPTGIMARLDKVRIDAGWDTSLAGLMARLIGSLIFAAVIAYYATSSPLVAIAAPLAVAILYWIVISQRIARRVAIFEAQLIDGLGLAARSLRVGHPLVGAFRLISEEVPAPIGTLFAQIVQQQELGVSIETSLRSAAESYANNDLRLFATSVIIQLRSGGNLADMMERLANVIRERNRLARRVRVLTAQTQFSKRVLLALPFFIFVLLTIVNPDYMRPLYTTFTGQMILAVAGVGLFIGWVLMNWLSKITI